MTDREKRLRRRIKLLLSVFIVGLVLSGVTAFPLETELGLASEFFGIDPSVAPDEYSGFSRWIALIAQGLRETNERFPFLAYGTDWLAFGHLVIALFFIGPLRDPVRNSWVVTAGMIACVAVIPLALIAGEVRGIPLEWRLFDCSFGVLGLVPLWLVRRYTNELVGLDDGEHSVQTGSR